MKEDFKSKAINPQQYDSPDLDWKTEVEESPIRKFFAYYLEQYIGDLSDKKVIDIGSGTGYLSKLYIKLGAIDIYGIEPAKANVVVSQKFYPKMKVTQSSLEDFKPEVDCEVAVSVMVFEHIDNLGAAFNKIYQMLKYGGYFFMVVGDIIYLTTPRYDYNIQTQKLEDGEVAMKTQRRNGIMYDIARPTGNYIRYAESVGFKKVKDIPMPPTKDLIEAEPKYAEFKGKPLTHLLIFKKRNQ